MLTRTIQNRLVVAALLLFVSSAGASWAEPLSNRDREEIARLRAAQGRSAEGVNVLIEQVVKAGERGLPTEPLANKVKEGLAKGVEPKRIEAVLRQLVTQYDSANGVLQESADKGMVDVSKGNRQQTLEWLAEALSRGATVEEVRELARTGHGAGERVSQDSLASGAKSLAILKEANIPAADGTALVVEGMRHGYRPTDLADLAREIKRRGSDVEHGQLDLQSIKEQISKGERVDRLFHDSDRSGSGDSDRRDRSSGPHRDEQGDRKDHDDHSVGRDDHGGRSDRGRQDDRGGRDRHLDRGDDRRGHDDHSSRPERGEIEHGGPDH